MRCTRIVFSLAAASATSALLLSGSSGPASAQAALPAETRQILLGQLEYYSTMPQLLIAEMLGVTEIQGKPIKATIPSGTKTSRRSRPAQKIRRSWWSGRTGLEHRSHCSASPLPVRTAVQPGRPAS